MKVKDYEVKGSSAKEVLEGIMEEHTNAKVSRISEGLYNVHLELEEEQPALAGKLLFRDDTRFS